MARDEDLFHLEQLAEYACPYRLRPEWVQEVDRVYALMREAASAGPYEISICGLNLVVLPEVYAPGFFTDSEWFAKQLMDVVTPGSFLEIGTGTGLHAVLCAARGLRVVAADINPRAISNTIENASRAGVDVDARLSDVYGAILSHEKFDTIFWAHPFNNFLHRPNGLLDMSGFDQNYTSVIKYISAARQHLSRDGRLLLGTGDTADLQTICRVASSAGFSAKVLRHEAMPLDRFGGPPITYLLVEFH